MPIIDDAFLASLNVEPVVAPVTEDQGKLFAKIQRLCVVRERSSEELRQRFLREGFSEEDVAGAIGRAMRCLLVDDMRFAEVLVRSRISQGKGIAGIEAELQQNGIDPAGVAGWPEEYVSQGVSEEDRAFDLLASKPPRAKNQYQAAVRKLVSKGYSINVACQAARRFINESASID